MALISRSIPPKHRTYPLKLILDSLTLYNRFYSLVETAKLVSHRHGIAVSTHSILTWLDDFRKYLPILKFRPAILAQYDPREVFIEARLLHGQVFDFKCHYAKLDLLIKEQQTHWPFRPLLQLLLETIPMLCPHKLFRDAARAQTRILQHQALFDLDEVSITSLPTAPAVKTARLVYRATAQEKHRQQTLDEFLLVNDAITVAVEVPVLLNRGDLEHLRQRLGFEVPLELRGGEVIIGHIDILQIQSGMIHLLDFQPSARKVNLVEQLTLYALALSQLTGLELSYFKCAWFDNADYFEFCPSQVLAGNRKKS